MAPLSHRFLAPAVLAAALLAPPCARAEDRTPPATEFQLKADDGMRLSATYYAPPSGAPSPALLFLHDFGEDASAWKRAIPFFWDRGNACLALDLRGHGKSTRKWEPPDTAKVEALKMGTRENDKLPLDVKAAAQFLRKRSEVLSSKIVGVGAGWGANVALQYAAEAPDKLAALVLLSPRAEIRGLRLPETWPATLPPVFLAYSDDDPHKDELAKIAQTIEQASPRNKVIRFAEDADRCDIGSDLLVPSTSKGDLRRKLLDWIAKTAQAEPQGQAPDAAPAETPK